MKTYVTFKENHFHSINGHIFDEECVAVINCRCPHDGRNKAFQIFGARFKREYSEFEFNKDWLKQFPKGLIEVN